MLELNDQRGYIAKPCRLAIGVALATVVAVASGGCSPLRHKGTAQQPGTAKPAFHAHTSVTKQPLQAQDGSAQRPADSKPAAAAATQATFVTHSSAHRPSAATTKRKRSKGKNGGPSATAAEDTRNYRAGESPEYAASHGWAVKVPDIKEGSILPSKRIVAYYGNPLSKKMGVLGEYQKDEMLRRLKNEAAKWEKADPQHPVQPALHLIISVAQGVQGKGKAGKYRMIMPDKVVEEVYRWAKSANALMFIDIQTGHDNIRTLLPRFEWILKNKDVHLGIDPEFNLIASGKVPGTSIGSYDASDINFAAGYLEGLVKKYNLPPKVLVVHRFTQHGVTNSKSIKLRSDVQIVINMDGWGEPWLKRVSYRDYVVKEPVQYTGFKLFYHNDTKKGDALLTPAEILRLEPKPLYIMYQ